MQQQGWHELEHAVNNIKTQKDILMTNYCLNSFAQHVSTLLIVMVHFATNCQVESIFQSTSSNSIFGQMYVIVKVFPLFQLH